MDGIEEFHTYGNNMENGMNQRKSQKAKGNVSLGIGPTEDEIFLSLSHLILLLRKNTTTHHFANLQKML